MALGFVPFFSRWTLGRALNYSSFCHIPVHCVVERFRSTLPASREAELRIRLEIKYPLQALARRFGLGCL